MLVLQRRSDEGFTIGDEIVVQVSQFGRKITVAIHAPRRLRVERVDKNAVVGAVSAAAANDARRQAAKK